MRTTVWYSRTGYFYCDNSNCFCQFECKCDDSPHLNDDGEYVPCPKELRQAMIPETSDTLHVALCLDVQCDYCDEHFLDTDDYRPERTF